MITVVMLCWKRLERLEEVIQSWLDQDEVDEFILCDNSGTQFKTDLPIIVLNSNKNYGTYFRYAAPLLAKNNLICWADDDFLMAPGLAGDLLDVWSEDRLVGIMGKNFTGDTYYTATGVRGKKVDKPTQVDYLCGNSILGHRKNFLVVDMMTDMPKFVHGGKQLLVMGDWWWQHRLQEKFGTTLWVATTDKYKEMAIGKDAHAYHTKTPFQTVREYYFRKWVKGNEDRPLHEVDPGFLPEEEASHLPGYLEDATPGDVG